MRRLVGDLAHVHVPVRVAAVERRHLRAHLDLDGPMREGQCAPFDVLAGPAHLMELVGHRVGEGSLTQIEDLSGGRGTEEESDQGEHGDGSLTWRLRAAPRLLGHGGGRHLPPLAASLLALLLRAGVGDLRSIGADAVALGFCECCGRSCEGKRGDHGELHSGPPWADVPARDSSARPRGLASIAPCSIGGRPLGLGRTSVKGSRSEPPARHPLSVVRAGPRADHPRWRIDPGPLRTRSRSMVSSGRDGSRGGNRYWAPSRVSNWWTVALVKRRFTGSPARRGPRISIRCCWAALADDKEGLR